MLTEQYYQDMKFGKEISKSEAILISKKLNCISNPFEPITNITVRQLLEAFLNNPDSETYQIEIQMPYKDKTIINYYTYESHWDKKRKEKFIYSNSIPQVYYTISEHNFVKHVSHGNMYIVQGILKLPVCLSALSEKTSTLNKNASLISDINCTYKYSNGSVLKIKNWNITEFYDNEIKYHNFFTNVKKDNSILINNVYNYSILMVCFMAGGKEDMNPVFDSDKKNTMYINYTTETGRIANCIYSNEEDDPLFNKDFLSACIYWGKKQTHPQNVGKWIEECLDRYNKIKRYYKEEV